MLFLECHIRLSSHLESGKLFSFGGNEDGQLGHGDRNVSK